MNSRAKNASRNIFFGIILKIYQIIVPFLMRTAIIYYLGVQYLGLNSLFASILQVLNLTELGVGSAMVYSMYKPIADNDEITLCALLKLYKTYYRIIGTIIALIGVILTPFVPRLIKGDIPLGLNIYVLYLLNLFATVLSYWLFAYKNSLLQAHQRVDVVSKINLITNTLQYIVQLLVLFLFRNYYLYVITFLAIQAMTNICTAIVVTKMYPKYQPIGSVDKNIKEQIDGRIRDLFTAKIGTVVVGSVDTIVISAFLGLVPLAIYQNYYYIMNAVYGLVLVVFSSVLAGIGNSLVKESMEKNYNDLKKFTFLISWLITICVCCFAVMYQPFMKLWVGDELMLDYSYVIMFCIYFYVLVLAMIWATIKDAAGLWHQDRFRPLAGAAFNLMLNVLLVNVIGLYGIILSTVLSYILVSMPWLIHNIFKYIYKRSMREYLYKLFKYLLVCMLSCLLTVIICSRIELQGVCLILTDCILAVTIPCILQILIYRKTNEFAESRKLITKMIKNGDY